MLQVSEKQQHQVIDLIRDRAKHIDIAHHFECSRQATHNIATRYANTGSVCERQRPNQRRVTSGRDHHVITLIHLCNRFKLATMVARQYGIYTHKKSKSELNQL